MVHFTLASLSTIPCSQILSSPSRDLHLESQTTLIGLESVTALKPSDLLQTLQTQAQASVSIAAV